MSVALVTVWVLVVSAVAHSVPTDLPQGESVHRDSFHGHRAAEMDGATSWHLLKPLED